MFAHSPTHLENANPQKIAAQWRAVANRDASVNTFVYAVRTTGIYCRPSCPARLARRANVDFFDSPTLAEAAGYRSCKRCHPNDQTGDPQVQLVQAACDSIAAAVSSGGKVKLEELAETANFTPSHFHRVFKKLTGVTPGQYAKELNQQGFNGGESYGNLEHDGAPGILDEDRLFDELIDWDANA